VAAIILIVAERVASAILADVEPGFQPGGKNATAKPEYFWKSLPKSGRQDAALYGRLEACRHYRRLQPLDGGAQVVYQNSPYFVI
jgi:hypothetical protein